MIQVKTETLNDGSPTYAFCANNTDYFVIEEKTGGYQVQSNRRGFSGFPGFAFYETLEELASRSKAFGNFALLIKDNAPVV